MILAKVIGTVVSPIQAQALGGRTHLIIQPVSPAGEPNGKHRVAIDSIGSGTGDLVLVVDEGNSARQVLGDSEACIRTVIVGFVDRVELQAD